MDFRSGTLSDKVNFDVSTGCLCVHKKLVVNRYTILLTSYPYPDTAPYDIYTWIHTRHHAYLSL